MWARSRRLPQRRAHQSTPGCRGAAWYDCVRAACGVWSRDHTHAGGMMMVVFLPLDRPVWMRASARVSSLVFLRLLIGGAFSVSPRSCQDMKKIKATNLIAHHGDP